MNDLAAAQMDLHIAATWPVEVIPILSGATVPKDDYTYIDRTVVPWWRSFIMNRPRPTRVLVVEDQEDQRRLVQLWLDGPGEPRAACGNDGWEISEATTLEEACEAISSHTYDCILLDLGLGIYTAEKVFDTVKECAGKQPIVVMSNNTDDSIYEYVMAHGAAEFIPKMSVHEDGLKHSICNAMRWSELEQVEAELSAKVEEHLETSANYRVV